MLEAIKKEILWQQSYLQDEIATIYFGGGTPSLLKGDALRDILSTIHTNFKVSAHSEITLEANPDDIHPQNLDAWKEAGINRLSIGIQSFFEEDLQWMNRAHNALQARQCIEMAKSAGFFNLTIDLIYGTPGLSDENWKQNVDTAISLGIPHLSCYALTVEPKTALAKMIARQQSQNVEADDQARQFGLLTTWLANAGFEHYEISNFAKPGFRSRHNSSYWQGKHYLGIGPSAHSFNGHSRQWNLANNAEYLLAIDSGRVPFELEVLTPAQQLNEYLMTTLRTIEGISLNYVSLTWGEEKAAQVKETAQKHIGRGHLAFNGDFLQLTIQGKFLADGIASDLFETE